MEDIAWRTDAHVCAPVCLDFDKLSAVRYPVRRIPDRSRRDLVGDRLHRAKVGDRRNSHWVFVAARRHPADDGRLARPPAMICGRHLDTEIGMAELDDTQLGLMDRLLARS